MLNRLAVSARSSPRRLIVMPRRGFVEEIDRKTFGRKEKAQEDQYARSREQEALKKLKQQIQEAQNTLESLKKEAEAKEGKN